MLILHELSHSPSSLMQASLVCRAWRVPAQQLIFSSIYLRSDAQCKKLQNFLKGHPGLLSNTSRLSIVEHEKPHHLGNLISVRTGRGLQSGGKPYLHLPGAMSFIPSLAASVRSLDLFVLPWRDSTLHFVQHFKRVQKLRVHGAQSISAETFQMLFGELVELNDISLSTYYHRLPQNPESDFDARLLRAADNSVAIEQSRFSTPISLKSLVLMEAEHLPDLLETLSNEKVTNLSGLGYLYLRWTTRPIFAFRFVDALFQRGGSSLKTLVVEIPKRHHMQVYSRSHLHFDHYTMNPELSPLKYLTGLRKLKIITGNDMGFSTQPFLISDHLALLYAIPSIHQHRKLGPLQTETLHKVQFKIFLELGHSLYVADTFSEWMEAFEPAEDGTLCEWTVLDTLLAELPAFKQFSLDIVLRLVGSNERRLGQQFDAQMDDLRDRVEACMPKTRQSNQLKCDYRVVSKNLEDDLRSPIFVDKDADEDEDEHDDE
ncbi:hypothetical protein K435DRAFT_969295 [Dendrothele bispora CBS 962.96]|uniref:F-box domain-containing protein n=1 Tax=Dendrothele bispora (strain CBS 962.96) TaxID=1314807 RepID=A0A4S8LIT8_DENBC|nr:hypothetical protein K435DRAFT_969295 [Dendrothele bispora CBS 962.96]